MKKSPKKSPPTCKATASGLPVYCEHTLLAKASDLTPHPHNTNTHSDEQIRLLAKSIGKFGWRHPITVSTRGEKFIVAGHGRLMAAKVLNLELVPVDFQHFDTLEQERAVLIADNRLAELAEIDKGKMKDELSFLNGEGGFDDLEVIGFTDKDFESMMGLSEASTTSALEVTPDVCKKTLSKVGDVFKIVNLERTHMLVCGDATDKKLLKHFETRKADLVFSDPPYGVSYVSDKNGKIKNDELRDDGLAKMLRGALELCVAASFDHAGFYIWHASSTRRDFEWAMQAVGLEEKQYLVWVKDSFTLGRSDYHWQTEPCFYAQKAGKKAQFFGGRSQSTVWRVASVQSTDACVSLVNGVRISNTHGDEILIKAKVPKDAKKLRLLRVDKGVSVYLVRDNGATDAWEVSSDTGDDLVHPTQKPIGLALRAIRNATEPGQLVLDCFGRSGSTAVACEHAGRDSFTVELDPKFVDIIVKRMMHLYPTCIVERNGERIELDSFPE